MYLLASLLRFLELSFDVESQYNSDDFFKLFKDFTQKSDLYINGFSQNFRYEYKSSNGRHSKKKQ